MRIGSVQVPSNDNRFDVSKHVPVLKYTDKEWVELRLLPALSEDDSFMVANHWIQIATTKGVTSISKSCLGFDTKTGKILADKCPYCQEFGAPRIEYFYQAIVRSLQENEPRKLPKHTKEEESTGFKDPQSKSYTPIRAVRFTGSLITAIQKLIDRKRSEPDDVKSGFDISIYYDGSAKSASQMYTVQQGETTPLTPEEWDKKGEYSNYLVYDFSGLHKAYAASLPSYDQAAKDIENLREKLVSNEDSQPKRGRGRTEDLDEDDDDDEPPKKQRSRNARFDDTDDDDEPPKKKRSSRFDDTDDDDEPPKRGRGRSNDDSDEDDDDEPPKRGRGRSRDDGDDDLDDDLPKNQKRGRGKPQNDEDDDNEPPKKRGRGRSNDDEDDDDEPPKRSRGKPQNDEDDDNEPPKKRGRGRSNDSDDDDLDD